MRNDRREALRAIAAGVFTAALSSKAGRSALAAETARLLPALPVLNDPERPSLEIFQALSELLTCRASLDRKVSAKMYPLFIAEPWGAKHMATAYSELVRLLVQRERACSAPELIAAGALPKGETWFCGHVLETWYHGVYYHERLNVRVLYEDALMWDVLRDWVTIPGVTARGPGDWAKPPRPRRGASRH